MNARQGLAQEKGAQDRNLRPQVGSDSRNAAQDDRGASPLTRSDEALMMAYQDGALEAFEELYRRYERPIYNFLRRAATNPASTDDLFQKTFLKLHVARRRYRPEAPFRKWLFTLALNVVRDDARQRRRSSRLETEVFDESRRMPASMSDEPRETQAIGLAVTQALASLPFHQRQAIILSRYHGMSYEEIGELLGLSSNAVKQRAFQAMRRLKQRLVPLDAKNIG